MKQKNLNFATGLKCAMDSCSSRLLFFVSLGGSGPSLLAVTYITYQRKHFKRIEKSSKYP